MSSPAPRSQDKIIAASPPASDRRRVGIIEGTTPRFDDATLALLRQRLGTLTLLVAAFSTAALATTLEFPGLGLRLIVLAVVAAAYAVLRSAWPLPVLALRALEWLLIGCLTSQALFMPAALMLERARAGDPVTVVMDAYFNLGAWSIFIMSYGMVIPNTWRRALVVLLPLACLPYVNFSLLCRYEPAVQEAFDALHYPAPIPLPLFAALAGTYCAHVMHGMRRETFEAKRFGQYRLHERLGAGGMGEVYRAEHQLLKRPCAIKLIRPGIDAHAEVMARFEREVQATACLSHWNTVEIYDYGRTDAGVFYYVMEYLPGLSLAELVRRHGPLPAGRVVYLMRQICAGLGEAHEIGLIHRDIKPANIFAARRGGLDDVVKVLDFGLVKLSASTGQDAHLTQEGVISGSPPYMSPEQGTTAQRVDERSDLYSLGAVAYFLLTGQPPFSGRSAMELIIAHARDPVVPPSERQRGVPADLESIILRCLEKQPDRRYSSAADLERDLAGCACAGDWNAARAAAWWKALPDKRDHPAPTMGEPSTAVVPQG